MSEQLFIMYVIHAQSKKFLIKDKMIGPDCKVLALLSS